MSLRNRKKSNLKVPGTSRGRIALQRGVNESDNISIDSETGFEDVNSFWSRVKSPTGNTPDPPSAKKRENPKSNKNKQQAEITPADQRTLHRPIFSDAKSSNSHSQISSFITNIARQKLGKGESPRNDIISPSAISTVSTAPPSSVKPPENLETPGTARSKDSKTVENEEINELFTPDQGRNEGTPLSTDAPKDDNTTPINETNTKLSTSLQTKEKSPLPNSLTKDASTSPLLESFVAHSSRKRDTEKEYLPTKTMETIQEGSSNNMSSSDSSNSQLPFTQENIINDNSKKKKEDISLEKSVEDLINSTSDLYTEQSSDHDSSESPNNTYELNQESNQSPNKSNNNNNSPNQIKPYGKNDDADANHDISNDKQLSFINDAINDYEDDNDVEDKEEFGFQMSNAATSENSKKITSPLNDSNNSGGHESISQDSIHNELNEEMSPAPKLSYEKRTMFSNTNSNSGSDSEAQVKVSKKKQSKSSKKKYVPISANSDSASESDSQSDDSLQIQERSNKKKKQNKVVKVTPFRQGIALARNYESIPASQFKSEDDEYSSDENKNIRRSRRAKFPPLEFWRNEKLVYQANNDFEDKVLGDMPVVGAVMKALPTPYKKRKVISKSVGRKKKGKVSKNKSSDNEELSGKSVDTLPIFDDSNVRKKYDIMDTEVADIWDESLEGINQRKVVCHASKMVSSTLPITRQRDRSESRVVGSASQAFNIPEANDLLPGWISGHLILPPKGIKDAEGVGMCSQVFSVQTCQRNSLEVSLADPEDSEYDPDTSQRFLLNPGDFFHVPPNNVYRIENHSSKAEAKLLFTIIRPMAQK